MIGFRTTASETAGYGHVRRCLTLARASKRECVFFLPKDVQHLVRDFPVREWSRDHGCKVIVCDDYALDGDDVREAMVLDDPMQRGLYLARWIVNPTIGARYESSAEQLCGPRYALLDPAFRGLPTRTAAPVKRVLVSLGGADPAERTLAVVQALQGWPMDVVVGPLFSSALKDKLEKLPVTLHSAPDSLAPLMLQADVLVCAGGQTVYEAAACGLPALALQLADNQRLNLHTLADVGTLRVTTEATLAADLRALDEATRLIMSQKGQLLVDGLGADRVAAVLR